MKKLLLLLLLCFVFSACERRVVPDPFSGDFTCEISFARGGTAYTLAYAKVGERERAAVVAPATLAGLMAVREGGAITLSHADVTFTALAADGLFAFADCLVPKELSYLADGCYGTDGYKLYTDSAGIPTRVCTESFDLRILRFEGGITR